MVDEKAVWARFKSGSETDFAYIYRKYAPVMFRYGCKISRDRDLVKDSLQQVFLSMWKGRHNLQDTPCIKNYLLKAIRCEVYRKTGQQLKYENISEDFLEVVSSSESNLIEAETARLNKARVKDVMAKLPQRQREVLFLKYYNNLSYAEIADIMGIDQDSVYKLTYKALQKAQRLFLKISAAILLLATLLSL